MSKNIEFQAQFDHQQPTRVAVLVRGNSEYRTKPAEVIIEHALWILGIPGTETLYLACEDWGRTMHFVFDIFHTSYDFNAAHDIDDLTVLVVSLGGKNEKAWLAPPSLREQVNQDVAELHNLNGWETRPPYFATHACGAVPTYDNPRVTRSAQRNG